MVPGDEWILKSDAVYAIYRQVTIMINAKLGHKLPAEFALQSSSSASSASECYGSDILFMRLFMQDCDTLCGHVPYSKSMPLRWCRKASNSEVAVCHLFAGLIYLSCCSSAIAAYRSTVGQR